MSNQSEESTIEVLEAISAALQRTSGALNNLNEITQNQDTKIRTLQSQVYALREDLKLVTEGHNKHVDNNIRHSCGCGPSA